MNFVNGRTPVERDGDPENDCEAFDGAGYNGTGECLSDGHYACVDCSKLSPQAPRFLQYAAQGRLDRLRLFARRKERRA